MKRVGPICAIGALAAVLGSAAHAEGTAESNLGAATLGAQASIFDSWPEGRTRGLAIIGGVAVSAFALMGASSGDSGRSPAPRPAVDTPPPGPDEPPPDEPPPDDPAPPPPPPDDPPPPPPPDDPAPPPPPPDDPLPPPPDDPLPPAPPPPPPPGPPPIIPPPHHPGG